MQQNYWGQEALVLRSLEYADDQRMGEATELILGCPRDRRLEEKVMVMRITRRLTTFSTGAYCEAGQTIATEKVFVQWNQAPMKCPGAIRDEEIDQLQLLFKCHGCGRPEANMLCKWGHERHCPSADRVVCVAVRAVFHQGIGCWLAARTVARLCALEP